jgi:endonuclease G, mitochondrial
MSRRGVSARARWFVVGIVIGTAPLGGNAADTSSPLCFEGCPVGAPATNTLIGREIYVLSNNPQTKFADWVAYRISSQSFGPTRSRNWRADPELESEDTLEPADYARANEELGVDRGHQAPLASVAGSPRWREANYLSNITPQSSALNQGPWERLEQAERDVVAEGTADDIYVVTGPLYERQMQQLPAADEPHRVPSGYWKLITIPTSNGFDVVGFILDQDTERSENFCENDVIPGDIEQRTKLTFFSDLDDATRQNIKDGKAVGGAMTALGC